MLRCASVECASCNVHAARVCRGVRGVLCTGDMVDALLACLVACVRPYSAAAVAYAVERVVSASGPVLALLLLGCG